MTDAKNDPPSNRPVTIAERRFAERADELRALDLPSRFARIHETNLWNNPESRSGDGSSLALTAHLRVELPKLLGTLGVTTLLDVPCGDFHWMSHVDLAGAGVAQYVGGDIVQAIVAANTARYATAGRTFALVDLTTGPFPSIGGDPADALLCRDCLVHFSYANIARTIDVLRSSGVRYLITTTFVDRTDNDDIEDGNWRPLALTRPPFLFPTPLAVLLEECTEEGGAYADKALGAWRVSDLPRLELERPAARAPRPDEKR